MEGKCIVSTCGKAASKCCGSCGFVRYCSVECQRVDWKEVHKIVECVNMKKLALANLTEEEIKEVVDKIMIMSNRIAAIGEVERSIDVMKECIAFVRDRLGQLNRNDSHGLIGDCVRPNNLILCSLLNRLGHDYQIMLTSSESDHHAIFYLSESREMLVQMRDGGVNDMEMWQLLIYGEAGLYHLHVKINQFEKAKYYAVESVATARQYKGPDQIDNLLTALSVLSAYLTLKREYPEALSLAEEEYMIASKHYSPAHKIVLRASRQMIE